MANFIGLAYAVVKEAGYDTSKMSATEVVDKYNELQKKTGQKEATPKEFEKINIREFEPNKETIKKFNITKDEMEWFDYKTENVEWTIKGELPKRKGGMFDTKTIGGYSKYDKFLKDKNNIEQITPNEYFEKCAEGFGLNASDLQKRIEKDKVALNHLFNVVFIKNKKFPMPYLDRKKYSNQEGLHRMYIAGQVSGWNTPQPVLRVEETGE